jgi:hypothetical protein
MISGVKGRWFPARGTALPPEAAQPPRSAPRRQDDETLGGAAIPASSRPTGRTDEIPGVLALNAVRIPALIPTANNIGGRRHTVTRMTPGQFGR